MNHVLKYSISDVRCSHIFFRNERYLSNVSIRRNEFFSSHQQFFCLFSNTSFNSILLLMWSYYLIFEWKSIFHVSLTREARFSGSKERKKNIGGSLLESKRK